MSAHGEEELYGSELGAGAQVGPWVVEAFRSKGGFASVYRVRHHVSGACAALKVLHAELARSPRILKRFARETRAVSRLDHPNVCKLIDFGQLTDRRPYCVMEWLEGRDLEEELEQRGSFSLEEGLAIMEDICGAVSAAHRLGIVHRDIKPANVIVVAAEPRPRAVLVDFGLAKVVAPEDEDVRLTRTGVVLGTPSCMAPEQITGGPIDERTDIYGLGVMLFFLLTGTKPYEAATAIEIEEMHLGAPPPKPSDRAAVPAALDAVVERAMAKQAENRFPSADALCDELRRAVMGERPRATQNRALGVYVEVRVNEAVGDAAYDEADDRLWSIRERLEELGLSVALEAGSSFLAVTYDLSPPDRRRWLTAAAELAGKDPALTVTVAVHVDAVERAPGDADELVGGALLRLADWTADLPAGQVTASETALEGLEDDFAATPAPLPGFRTLTGS